MNKKAYTTQIFGFFFVLTIFAAIFLFITFGLHYILYDYGMVNIDGVANTLLNSTGQAKQNIEVLEADFLGLTGYFDILFLVIIVSVFIESTIAAVMAREAGIFSFFGFVTIGNLFLIFIMHYAVEIQGWLLNEIVYDIILVSFETPILSMFLNYNIYIGILWYLWLLAVNQINFNGLKEKFNLMFGRNSEQLTTNDGRFEE